MAEDKGLSLPLGDRWVRYTPADPVTDAADIPVMLQALADMIAARQVDDERLARLVAPYVEDATVEELAAIFKADANEFVRLHHRILIRVLYEGPST